MAALFSVAAVLAAVIGVLAAIFGLWLEAAQFLLWALSFGVYVVCMVKIRLRRFSPYMTADDQGTTFRPDRGYDRLTVIVFVNSFFVGVAVPLAVWFVQTVSSAPTSSLDPLQVFLLHAFTPLVLAAGLGLLVWGRVRWGAFAYLRLTPDGADVSAGPWLRSLRWDEVADVTPGSTGPFGSGRSVLVFTRTDGRKRRLQGGVFTKDGTALRDLVRFYLLYPEVRGELTDGVAQRRLEERLESLSQA